MLLGAWSGAAVATLVLTAAVAAAAVGNARPTRRCWLESHVREEHDAMSSNNLPYGRWRCWLVRCVSRLTAAAFGRTTCRPPMDPARGGAVLAGTIGMDAAQMLMRSRAGWCAPYDELSSHQLAAGIEFRWDQKQA